MTASPDPRRSDPRAERRRSLISTALLAILVVSLAAWSWNWWTTREMESKVAFWREDATQCARNRAYGEAEMTWLWLMTAFPRSNQMAEVCLEYARFCLEDLGQVTRARSFVRRQLDYYPLSLSTLDAWTLLDEINRAADLASPYPEGSAWGEFVYARRVLDGGPPEAGIAALQAVLKRYPRSALVPDVLLAAGDAACELTGNRTLARGYYAELRQRFPGHALIARIPSAEKLVAADETVDDRRRRSAQYPAS